MRTTLTLDDGIAQRLKAAAHRSGRPFKDIVNETLREGLAAKKSPTRGKPYRLKTFSMGGVMPGYDLHKALALADALEDEEIARKLSMRK